MTRLKSKHVSDMINEHMDQTPTIVLGIVSIAFRMAYNLLHLLLMMIMISVMMYYNQIIVSKSRFPVKAESLFKTQYQVTLTTKHYLTV
jgi:hypothetical protein